MAGRDALRLTHGGMPMEQAVGGPARKWGRAGRRRRGAPLEVGSGRGGEAEAAKQKEKLHG